MATETIGIEATSEEGSQNEAQLGRKKVVHIAVNGEAATWGERKITYEEVVHVAFPSGPSGPNIRYSVAWTKPDGQEGSLRPGKHVSVVEGMAFDVRNTDKS